MSRSVGPYRLNRSNRPNRRIGRPSLGVVAALMLLVGSSAGCGTDLEAAASSTSAAADSSSPKGSSTSVADQTTTSDAGGLSGGNAGLGSKLGEEAVSLPGLGGTSDQAFGPEVEACLDREAAGLSPADADAVTNDRDFSGLSPEGSKIVADAMNTCIPAEALAEVFSEEFITAAGGKPNPQFTACLTSELDGQVGDLLIDASMSPSAGGDEVPQPVLDLLDACGDLVIGDLFVDQFIASGATPEVAQCIADGISAKLTMSDLVELGQTGTMPPGLEDEIVDLGAKCGMDG